MKSKLIDLRNAKIITMFFAVFILVAIIIQLLYVPHRIYEVNFSSQNVPHLTSKYILYNWVGESYYDTYKGEIYITSKIAFDVIALQITVTLLIALTLYILLYAAIKKERKKQSCNNSTPPILNVNTLVISDEETVKAMQEEYAIKMADYIKSQL